MTKRQHRSKHVALRSSRIIVRTCRQRVVGNVWFAVLGVFFASVLGTLLLIEVRPWLAAYVVLQFGVVPVIVALLWKSEIGKIVLTLEPNGINYYGQLISWSHIASVEFHDAHRRNRELVIMQRNGQSITVVDDLLDHSLELLHREIERRIDF